MQQRPHFICEFGLRQRPKQVIDDAGDVFVQSDRANRQSIAMDHGSEAIGFAQARDVLESLFAGSPITIHRLQRGAESRSISLVMSEDTIATVRQVVMMLHYFRIKAPQRNRIAQVIKKQLALLWN